MKRHGLVLALLAVGGCGWLERNEASPAQTQNKLAEKREHHEACASAQTANRLKSLAFDEAARMRGSDGSALDSAAGRATVRLDDAVVVSRDDQLNVTTCFGRLVVELPEGVAGERRITADVQYAAQSAADGSGMVYQMEGAEPLIQRLAAIGGVAIAETTPVTLPQASALPGAPRQPVTTPPAGQPPVKAPPPSAGRPPAAQPQAPRLQASANPSFNCRSARTRSERRVCASPGLAARDRQMSAAFYSALANADARTRQRLRSSRDRFLAFRERCATDACIGQAYSDRIDEIQDIAGAE